MIGFTFPNISPIIFSIGPVAIRWYSMAYLAGIVIGYYMILHYIKKYKLEFTKENIEDLAFYVVLGVLLGGRLGYTLFYGGNDNPFLKNPLKILEIWNGGMSFHGGIAGVIAAMIIYAKRFKFSYFQVNDLVVLPVSVGIFFGRIANFINDELWGRVTDVPWAVRFPKGGFLPRHPSQLYESFLEGLVIFVVLNWIWKSEWVRTRKGFVSAVFAILYSTFRSFVEIFREPDEQVGFLFGYMTMGQMLSLPLFVAGVVVIAYYVREHYKKA